MTDLAYSIRGWLPPGWVAEQYPRQDDVVIIERPREIGGGMVSLDFKLRVWNGGHQLPRSFPNSGYGSCIEPKYEGRGWKHKMVNDACTWLEQAMRPARGASGVQTLDGGLR